MNAIELLRRALLYTSVALSVVFGIATTPLAAQQQDQDVEVQMGQEVFNELKAKGEIVESSPLYDVVAADCGRHYPGGAAAIQPPVQVLSGT